MRLSALANRALAIKLCAAATTYGFTILMARTMLPQDFGKIAFFLNLSLVASLIGARGVQLAALRFIPPMLEKADTAGLLAFTRWSRSRCLVGTLAVFGTALAIALGAQNSGLVPNYSTGQLFLGLALIPLVGWIDLQSHFARGFHFLTLSLVPKEVLWRAATGTVILLWLMFSAGLPIGATFVLASLCLSLVLISGLQGIVLKRKIQFPTHSPRTSNAPDRHWEPTTGPFWITSVSNVFLANADVILVGLFVGPAGAGIYFAANRLAMLLAFFVTSYNLVLSPLLAKYWHKGGRQDIGNIIRRATVKMTIPTVVFGIILAVFAPQALGLFGPDFAQASTALRILTLATVINAATGPADIALNMCGFHHCAMRISATSLTASGALLTVGAASGSASGIALAVLVATTFRKSLFWWFAHKHLGIRTDILAAAPARLTRPQNVNP